MCLKFFYVVHDFKYFYRRRPELVIILALCAKSEYVLWWLLTYLQGLFITVILCYSNGEVIACLRKSCSCACVPSRRHLIAEGSTVTAMTHVSRRTSSFNNSLINPQISATSQEIDLLLQQRISPNDVSKDNNNDNAKLSQDGDNAANNS